MWTPFGPQVPYRTVLSEKTTTETNTVVENNEKTEEVLGFGRGCASLAGGGNGCWVFLVVNFAAVVALCDAIVMLKSSYS